MDGGTGAECCQRLWRIRRGCLVGRCDLDGNIAPVILY